MVGESLDHEGVRKAQHQRSVRIRSDGEPLGVEEFGGVVAQRADVDELDTLGAAFLQPTPGDVATHASAVHLGVLQRDSRRT